MSKEIEIECSNCGSVEYGGTQEWAEFWAEKKADGWRALKPGDEWLRLCPNCLADGVTFDEL